MLRDCGTCSVCCEVAAVPELDKPAMTPCQFQVEARGGCCSVFGAGERPKLCTEYICAWLGGVGGADDRPDSIGAMFSVNRTPRGRIGFAVETQPDAITSTAREMAVAFAKAFPMPLVVSAYGKRGNGEWVVIRTTLVEQATHMLGSFVTSLGPGVNMYERQDPPPMGEPYG